MVGHSIGGTISLMASLLRPGTFDKLCLICSSARYLDEPPHYRGGPQRHAAAARGNPDP